MAQNSRSGFPHQIGYARLAFTNGTPRYADPGGTVTAWGVFATGTPPVDNANGDTTFNLSRPLVTDALFVNVTFFGPCGADPVWARSAGWELPTATTLRVTTLVQPTTGGNSVLTDAVVDIEIWEKVPSLNS